MTQYSPVLPVRKSSGAEIIAESAKDGEEYTRRGFDFAAGWASNAG
jgi:hypothetical protein